MTQAGTLGTSPAIAMKSGGYYSARTKGAKDVIDNAAPLVLQALEAMDIADDLDRCFAIADYGSADAGTSLELMGTTVAAVRARAPRRPICLTYTDLPGNDFSQLFRNTQGTGDAGDFLVGHDNLYVFASGTSFYRQIFPNNSIHLGFSATALHWSSTTAGRISNHVHAVGARGPERAAFAEVGMRDWETILLHRAAELTPGGHLVLVNFCIDEEGRYLGNTGGVNMFDTFNELWAELRDEGVITAEEYGDTNFPQFYKTVEEFCAPLNDKDGPVYAAGLRLEHVETRVVPCPYKAEFLRHGDAGAFAPALVGTLRSWSETVFTSGLDPARPRAQRREIIDRFYRNYEERVRADPDGHAMDYVHVYMIISEAKN
ncbi:MAG: hypothetical protein ACE5GS_04110 [Kiloniellaceae bacterium]